MDIVKRRADQNKWAKRDRLQRIARGQCARCDDQICDVSKTMCYNHLIAQRGNRKNLPIWYDQFKGMKDRSKARGQHCLSKDEFAKWTESQKRVCCYCGIDESVLHSCKDKKKRRMTVDRMDNDQGYTLDNICYACYRCNQQKGNFFTHKQWMHIAKKYIVSRVYDYHNVKELCQN